MSISSDKEPFIDPLILNRDENANWYAADIYALGMTALRLCYGSTPPMINTKKGMER